MWVDGWASQGEVWEGSQEGQGCCRQRETDQSEALRGSVSEGQVK